MLQQRNNTKLLHEELNAPKNHEYPCARSSRMVSKMTRRPHTIHGPSKQSFILFGLALIGCVIGFNLYKFDVLSDGKNVLTVGFNVLDNGLNSSALFRNIAGNIFDGNLLWTQATQLHPAPQPVLVFNNINNGLCEFGVLGYAYGAIWHGIRFDWDVNNIFKCYFNESFYFNGIGNAFENAASGMWIFVFF